MPLPADGDNVKPVQSSPQVTPSTDPERTVSLDTAPSLLVEPDQVEAVAALFESNASKLTELISDGRNSLQMPPMAHDEVSKDAATGFTAAGMAHLDAVTGYRDWLQGIADGLRASAARYRSSEHERVHNFRGVVGG